MNTSEREQLNATIERLSKGENSESARVLRDYELDLPSGGVRLTAHLVGTHFHDAILV